METTHFQGIAGVWDREEEHLGDSPVEKNIHEMNSLCFHYNVNLSVTIETHRFPPLIDVAVDFHMR